MELDLSLSGLANADICDSGGLDASDFVRSPGRMGFGVDPDRFARYAGTVWQATPDETEGSDCSPNNEPLALPPPTNR